MKVARAALCLAVVAGTAAECWAAAVSCDSILSADRQRPTKSTLAYRARDGRCEGTIEQDHARSPKLIVQRYTLGDLTALSNSTDVLLFGRGLAGKQVGQITVLAPAHGYRLDVEVQGGGDVKWPLSDVFTRLALDPSTLFALGRTATGPDTVFFPVGVRKSASDVRPQASVLGVQYPAQSPLITAFLGTVSTEQGRGRRCTVNASLGAVAVWRNVGADDSLTITKVPQAAGEFCVRFEIQAPPRGSPDPVYDRQELFFVQ